MNAGYEIRQAMNIIAAVLVIAVCVILYFLVRDVPIACSGPDYKATAGTGQGVMAAMSDALRTAGIDPTGVYNLVDSANAANFPIQKGDSFTFCLEAGQERVGIVNGLQIEG